MNPAEFADAPQKNLRVLEIDDPFLARLYSLFCQVLQNPGALYIGALAHWQWRGRRAGGG